MKLPNSHRRCEATRIDRWRAASCGVDVFIRRSSRSVNYWIDDGFSRKFGNWTCSGKFIPSSRVASAVWKHSLVVCRDPVHNSVPKLNGIKVYMTRILRSGSHTVNGWTTPPPLTRRKWPSLSKFVPTGGDSRQLSPTQFTPPTWIS